MNEERLLMLAKFLREKVPREAFDFRTIVTLGKRKPLEALEAGGGCGTMACALGWTPAVFPQLVEWRFDTGLVASRKTGRCYYVAVAAELFDIPRMDASDLFTPNRSLTVWGITVGGRLPETATPKQVAERIEAYVRLAKKAKVEPKAVA